ncbi:septum formation initiator [Streptomyces shaanxiensis]|uniref:Septum formation initiator n=2 Tax=Streptomyces shaanxiensis TaxID=653357 RepID=A0ABP7VKX1_9ACTN
MRGRGDRARIGGDRGRFRGDRGRSGGDKGQVTVEFLGMMPLIIITLVLLWQFVLLGYTFSLAGNAADEAVRAATAADPGGRQAACQQAGLDKLPDAWTGEVKCSTGGGFVTADVRLEVPVLFPGAIGFPFTVDGHAGAVEEETG